MVKHVVAEAVIGQSRDGAALFQGGKIRIEGNLSQHDDHVDVGEQSEFSLQPRAAVA